jgi:hypothetical protein
LEKKMTLPENEQLVEEGTALVISEPRNDLARILPKHLADLHASGLSDETIKRWGCYSVDYDQKSVLVALGFGHLNPPALLLPILPPDILRATNDVIVKADLPRRDNRGRPAKYEVRPKSRNRIHAPLSIRRLLADPAVPLVITEGAKKSEKAAQEGICAISLSGVCNWRDRIGESAFPTGDFDLFPLGGRRLFLCFDSDAVANKHVQRAENDLAAFLSKRGAHVSVKRIPPAPGGGKVGLDDFLMSHTVEQFWQLSEGSMRFAVADWPDPMPLGTDLPAVEVFSLEFLPASFRPLIEDVSERMQTPLDYAVASAIIGLAGCVNRRALVQPKVEDGSWSVVPNLWGAIIGPPGFMKSPVMRVVTLPLDHIEQTWRHGYAEEIREFEAEKEQAELEHQSWRERYKQAVKRGVTPPIQPDTTLVPPAQKRLILTDCTPEKLHEILSENPAGVLVVRDELSGLLAEMDRPGREGQRAFFLQAWNGDSGFMVDRIGRGSIHVQQVCISLLANIQPSRLRNYLCQVFKEGPKDDGLFPRFQILVWPDTSGQWRSVDRPPNNLALAMAEKIYSRLANLSADDPIRLRFNPDAQELFFDWLGELERKVRDPNALQPPMVAHLAKFRGLMPKLAGLFALADRVADDQELNERVIISLDHARQAAAFCQYLESHARRVYSCVVSPEIRAARELARHVERGDLPEVFTTRIVYFKGWSGLDNPEAARSALTILEDAGWLRRNGPEPSSIGRPCESWTISPKVVPHGRE